MEHETPISYDVAEEAVGEREEIEAMMAPIENEYPCNILRFKNVMAQFKVPYLIYSDFESFIISDTHVPSGFCTYRVSAYGELYKPHVYSGDDVMQHFYSHLKIERQEITEILSKNLPMQPLTLHEEQRKERARTCITCNKPFSLYNKKTHHHDHVTSLHRTRLRGLQSSAQTAQKGSRFLHPCHFS